MNVIIKNKKLENDKDKKISKNIFFFGKMMFLMIKNYAKQFFL